MSTQINPSAKDARLATAILDALAAEDSSKVPCLVIGKQNLDLSSNLLEAFKQIAELTTARRTFSVMSDSQLLTTQQAADYLGYSRPTLIKLLEKFAVPVSTVGRHRKVSFEDLEVLRLAILKDQDDFLREMSNLEQKLGKDAQSNPGLFLPVIRVFIDADCLHKLYLRTLLLTLAGSGDIHILWTREVFEEARKSLVARFPEDSEKLRLKFDLIKTHFYGNEVKGYQWLIGTLGCRDLNDEHVLAGAIQGKADVLLTFNLRDFPKDSPQGLRVMHPDSFLSLWLEAKPKEGIQAISEWLARFENPPIEANFACLLVQKIDCQQLAAFIKKHRVKINRQIRAIRPSQQRVARQ